MRHAALSAIKNNSSLSFNKAVRFKNAAVAEHLLRQCISGFGRHHHQTAISLDQPLVFRKGVNGSLVNRQVNQAVPPEINRHLVSCRESSASARSGDGSFIAHFWGNQRHHTARHGVEQTLVDHRACAAGVAEAVFPCEEVTVEHVQR